jgi:hypothetical protein
MLCCRLSTILIIVSRIASYQSSERTPLQLEVPLSFVPVDMSGFENPSRTIKQPRKGSDAAEMLRGGSLFSQNVGATIEALDASKWGISVMAVDTVRLVG